MDKLRAFILPFICCLPTALVSAQGQTTTLQLGTPIERTLGPGQIHNYTINLEENNLAQVVIDQRGIDVVVRVYSPAGKSLGDYDSPNGNEGPENLSFVANVKGPYRISVAPLNQGQDFPAGRYEIKFLEQREATEEELKASKNEEALRAKGLALFAEIDGTIPQIRLPQTRISAQLRAGQILWDSDEKRASKYFQEAINGLKEFLATVDANSKQYLRGYSATSQLRFEIVNVLAGRDPEMALDVLHSTTSGVDSYGNPRDQAMQESALELTIANQIARTNPKRTLQVARDSLKVQYSSNLINTVVTLRRRNPELAAELAGDIATKLMGEKLLKNSEAASLAMSLLGLYDAADRRSADTSNGDAPRIVLLSEEQYRDLLQKAINEVLAYSPARTNSFFPEGGALWVIISRLRSMKSQVETILPGGPAALEKKLREFESVTNPRVDDLRQYYDTIANGTTDAALEAIKRAPLETREQLYLQAANKAAANGETARARQILNDYVSNPYQRQQALGNIEQQRMLKAISKGNVEEALRSIANLSSPRERAGLLIQIAGQIGPGQKRATALTLLEQARGMLPTSTQAQDQDQMNALFEIARAFARYDSKRAFDIVEPLVDQFNEISAAARTLEGFGSECFEDGELDLQNGNSVAGVAMQMSTALGTMSLTNFERAKLASDRIRLPEVRLRVYLEIAQQTIPVKKSSIP